jgi:hypothetical protein
MQANAGSTLHVVTPLTNFSAGTLMGGSYVVYGSGGSPGRIQVDIFGTTGGEITTNAATIALHGLNASLVDQNGNNALSAVAFNSGTLSVTDGANFQDTAATFTNIGTVVIGAPDDFSAGPYLQTAGTTQDDGTLAASVTVNGGLFEGSGIVTGNLISNSGTTVKPGDSPGVLTINGNYTEAAGATLQIDIGGLLAGSQYGVLNLLGDATFNGILKLVDVNGFWFPGGESDFFIADYANRSGQFTSIDMSAMNLPSDYRFYFFYDQGSDHNQLEVEVFSPEPATYFGIAGALAMFWLGAAIRKRKTLSC